MSPIEIHILILYCISFALIIAIAKKDAKPKREYPKPREIPRYISVPDIMSLEEDAIWSAGWNACLREVKKYDKDRRKS